MAIGDYYPGASVQLVADGVVIATAKGFQVDVAVNHEAVEEFGNILAVENVPNSAAVSGSMAMTFVKDNSPFAQGLTLRNKQQLLSFESYPVLIEDTRTGEQVMQVEGLRIQSQSYQFAKGMVAMINCTWIAIDATDEVNPDV